MNNITDSEIMQRVQAGEVNLIGTLYERYKGELFSYFYRCTSDKVKSEDLIQNVFIKVINNHKNFKGTGQFNYWLFRIARNTWLDAVKKKEPMLHAVPLQEEQRQMATTKLHSSTIDEQKKKLRNALNQISEEKREAIIMSRYQGMDYKTIAKISDCSESAIKSRIMRGLTEIRKIVNN